ncbi:MAG: PBP1A family penicillin-binding protein [Bacilli bacterium]|nr:PBP1A family penicillin-binding protein [Bacilli bacterium]
MKKFLKFNVIIMLLATLFYFGLYGYAKIIKKIDIKKENNYYMYDNNEELFNISDDWVKLDDISEYLINATISIEDKNFYNHIGFDYLRIIKALGVNIKNGGNVQGASTISQQYSKNLFLNFDKTWERKLNEAWITIQIESHYTKDEILEGYLNTINYGGVFGIENASYYYFNKSSKNLDLAEASMLAGIPKSPSNYSPLTNIENAKRRQKTILNTMVNNGYISKEQAEEAYNTSLEYYGKGKENESSTLMYYQDAVMDELKTIKSIPSSTLETGGLKIYTNLDLETQLNLEDNIKNYFKKDEEIQISSVMMDPNNGKIVALVGGRDYRKSQYNRAITASRQVGSTLKPFLYYSALENGFTASTTFNSSETTFVFSNDEKYSPKNYAEIYGNKDISMAAALAYSDNIYAVKTHLFLGEDNLINILNRVGINSKLSAIPSLALGTASINMVNMVKAYSVLANSGYKVTPHLINRVEDSKGNVLYEFKDEKEAILNESITYIVNEMLNNCYNANFIDYNYPTCINIASKLTNKYAIKTGTTDTDNLVFGYNGNMVLGIWAGYDDNKDTYPEVSSNIKNIFADTMETYFKTHDASWYEMPNNVVGVMVDPISGNIATDNSKKSILYYIKGTEPNSGDVTLDTLIPTIKEEN